jgi:hypothetical protein
MIKSIELILKINAYNFEKFEQALNAYQWLSKSLKPIEFECEITSEVLKIQAN